MPCAAIFAFLLLPFLCGASEQCANDDDFSVNFNSSQHFVVRKNGTCSCPTGGFTGVGRLLDLSQHAAVLNLTASANSLQAAITAAQATAAALQQTINVQQASINALVMQQGGAVPVSNLAPTRPTSCREQKTAVPASTSGIYMLMNPSGSVYQVYCDMTTDGGGWTQVWKAPSATLDTRFYEYFAGTKPIVAKSRDMLFAFADASNVLTQAWKFPTPASFIAATPMSIDYCNYDWINATRISDGLQTTQILRSGYSTFGNTCDDGCYAPGFQPTALAGGLWGHICLKGNTQVPGILGAVPAPAGFQDFPFYTGFAHAYQDCCSRSDQAFTTTVCAASRAFTIFVR